ncbi:hypothetical protein CesoFtcFv8_026689 [Champsocephalus esox]|uniref:Uncharacterized protein n=1 Tax=Champsocephalus esox TaxID=159716 RepID=A0AAN8AZV2_9TELE|nr:hypothetical protein CesoFtcFv8_026689 [Champsocephalus esox]
MAGRMVEKREKDAQKDNYEVKIRTARCAAKTGRTDDRTKREKTGEEGKEDECMTVQKQKEEMHEEDERDRKER